MLARVNGHTAVKEQINCACIMYSFVLKPCYLVTRQPCTCLPHFFCCVQLLDNSGWHTGPPVCQCFDGMRFLLQHCYRVVTNIRDTEWSVWFSLVCQWPPRSEGSDLQFSVLGSTVRSPLSRVPTCTAPCASQ